MSRHVWMPLAVASLTAGALTAQVDVGTKAPSFEFKKVLNDGPGSFGDLAGRVVILDFGETW